MSTDLTDLYVTLEAIRDLLQSIHDELQWHKTGSFAHQVYELLSKIESKSN